MRGLRRTKKFKTDKPSRQNLKRKPRGTSGREIRRMTTEGSHCEAKQKKVERKCRKLSTGIGRKAWKQAGRKRKAKGTKGTGEHRRNHCQGKTGRREKKEQKAE